MNRKKKKRTFTRKQLFIRYALTAVGIIAGLALILLIVELIMRASGKSKIKNAASTEGPTIVMDEVAAGGSSDIQSVNWKSGWVRYNGDIYEYNEDIMTFLIMGIDSHGTVQGNKDLVSGGQADGLFLVIVNPDDSNIKIFAVNRDTIVDVVMVGVDNGNDNIAPAQIAVQHGFGDGMYQSCELTRDAVSKLLYNIPIHGYASLNYDAIPIMNDMLGGIPVKVEGDWTSINKKWTDGAEVTLTGKESYDFVHYRDTNVFASQEGRLSRQKTYLKSFIKTALSETKSDITLPIKLYTELNDYIVTDMSADEISYLATTCAGYSFDSNDIYTMEGDIRMGEEFEEFYPNEELLKEQVIKLFYRKVEEQ